jgi:DNA polymerase III epsilon subunit family exonuclease
MTDFHPIYDAKLRELDIAVFDLETTGLYASKNAIIQIAAVIVESGQIGQEWMTHVNPGKNHRPIPDFIQKYTGISDDRLDDAPDLTSMMKQMDGVVGTRIVAGHNVKAFDLNFIHAAERKTGIDVQSQYYIDTLKLMRRLHPEVKSKKLIDCGKFYGISFDPNKLHDALEDTRLGAQVMIRQFDELAAREIHTFSEMIDFLS